MTQQARREELAKDKTAQVAPGVKIWRHATGFATVAEAVEYANLEPAQQAGEFGVAVDPTEGITGYYFY
jgi:hypothetical protein